ncbi:LLM class flavin-dependent oxidoreductase [Microbispora sp. RL4-1S]|uniref:LLM class flavin-dependent oxidoreductase n=1 Tax=Microbispora oryzae TaxID=2806554 RepID=A0A940WKG9_9ACTN|nr:LLM class flavin-dependent oxidoreductase [Microbispora oryzae]MBP2707344.1 LLM class flavin-dependent oxidoreductase [Microbispora oryzae]
MTMEFRFGIVAGLAPHAGVWTALARRAEDLGYSTLLTPDTLGTLPPVPALTAAATVTTTLRVGTFVLAAPYRNPRQLAWELAGLDFLSGGRLEVGVGTGRAAARKDAEFLGVPYGTGAERVAAAAALIREVRAAFAGSGGFSGAVQRQGPRVLLAVRGARTVSLAAEEADIVTLATQPEATEKDAGEIVAALRERAGDRFDQIEIGSNLMQIGDEPPAWTPPGFTPLSPDAIATVRGSHREMADTLLRRRDELGISYVTLAGSSAETFAPVVELLNGR